MHCNDDSPLAVRVRCLRKWEAMAERGWSVLFWYQLCAVFCGIYGVLDLEELKSVNYGIDIENTPIMFKEELPEGAVRLGSKHGQQYQCSYPEKVTKEKQEEKEKIALETGIPELLKPMEAGPCLLYNSQGWWDYEFCYGKYIRQFHMEEGKIHGEVIYLGHYESEYDWNNASAKQANRLNRYHSQRYVNGSECDLTGKARQTEVRFVCADGQGDYLGRVEEAESCVYVLTVYTTKICRHPYLKPPSVNRPVTITCSPLLDAEQYQEYLDDQKGASPYADAEDDTAGLTSEGMHESDPTQDKLFTDLLAKGIREMLAENTQDGNKAGLHKDILKSARDISDSIQRQLKQQTTAKNKNDDDDGDITDDDNVKEDLQKLRERVDAIEKKHVKVTVKSQVERKTQTSEKGSGTGEDGKRKAGIDEDEDEDEEDGDVMEEFDKGLQDIAASAQDKAQLATHTDTIRKALQSQFNDIIEEAQEELAQEAADDDPTAAVDKSQAYKKLSQTLNALLSRLENSQKDIRDMDDALEKMDGDSKQQQAEEVETAEPEEHGEAESEEKPATVDTQKESDPTASATSKERMKERIADAANKNNINVVKKRKSSKGKDVQVKFVTLGYYNDDGTIQVISGDDKSSISKVMVAVLGIGNEAAKEAEKHERLIDNYSFIWQKKTNQQKQGEEVLAPQRDHN
ncbi:hypothetical protein LSAT2_017379 [Lamellibrachia satsuma]|nr:hypothetical protein LSAT2_017379 [Lamellibrachia satsuma]